MLYGTSRIKLCGERHNIVPLEMLSSVLYCQTVQSHYEDIYISNDLSVSIININYLTLVVLVGLVSHTDRDNLKKNLAVSW